MNIFYDHQNFSRRQFGGISRYYIELIKEINNSEMHNAYLSVLLSDNVHLLESNTNKFTFNTSNKFSKYFAYGINTINNIIDLNFKKYDIYHPTYYHYFHSKKIKNTPIVVTFFDMTHELFSSKFKELAADKYIIKQKKEIAIIADKIIAISENTKNDIVNILDINPDKIDVVYLGNSFPTIHKDKEYGYLEMPYLIFVGKRNNYKNFAFFLKSIAHILIKFKVGIVCAGGGDFTKEEIQLLHSLKVENLVTQKKFVNDFELQTLYQNAIAFVFPSLYEGFGIPVLEAFSSGCPCVLSDQSSLPEIAINAALYFNPTDPNSISTAIEEIILNNELRTTLSLRGYNRLLDFSWKKTAIETISVYESCFSS